MSAQFESRRCSHEPCRRGTGQTREGGVLHFGLKGAIDYATKIFQMGGPLAKEYGWLADYLTTYKAAIEVGRWPKEFER